jgi:hypothetical protein
MSEAIQARSNRNGTAEEAEESRDPHGHQKKRERRQKPLRPGRWVGIGPCAAGAHVAKRMHAPDPCERRDQYERQRMKGEGACEVAVGHRKRRAREPAPGARHVQHRRHQAEFHGCGEQSEGKDAQSCDDASSSERAGRGPMQNEVQLDAPIGSQTSFMSFVKK